MLKCIVLSGYGINCEKETSVAVRMAGGVADILHFNTLSDDPGILHDYNMFVIPGGFSFGDELGSGKVIANKLLHSFASSISDFIESGNLILGICNGFQVLAKLGLLPYTDFKQRITLIPNDSGRFEDRWVYLKVNVHSPSIFLKGIDYLYLPVRHAEGKLVFKDDEAKSSIIADNLFALQYVAPSGMLSGYPFNPNGSEYNIAGITDPTGRVLGLMPHPEAYLTPYHSPIWTYKLISSTGLRMFENARKYFERSQTRSK